MRQIRIRPCQKWSTMSSRKSTPRRPSAALRWAKTMTVIRHTTSGRFIKILKIRKLSHTLYLMTGNRIKVKSRRLSSQSKRKRKRKMRPRVKVITPTKTIALQKRRRTKNKRNMTACSPVMTKSLRRQMVPLQAILRLFTPVLCQGSHHSQLPDTILSIQCTRWLQSNRSI